jgi:hypothetical protein
MGDEKESSFLTVHEPKKNTLAKSFHRITDGVFEGIEILAEDALSDSPRTLKMTKGVLRLTQELINDEVPLNVGVLKVSETKAELPENKVEPAKVEEFVPVTTEKVSQKETKMRD